MSLTPRAATHHGRIPEGRRITMIKHLESMGVGIVLSVALLTGCGKGTGSEGTEQPAAVSRCDDSSPDYLAFDASVSREQSARLRLIDEMTAMFSMAEGNPSTAAYYGGLVLTKYQDPGTHLRAEVQALQDKHFTGDSAAVGAAIDTTLMESIEALRTSTTKQEVSLAKQRFQKAGIYRFLYLSVMQALYTPSYRNYDTAYGYLGTGQDNQDGGRTSLALVATSRDSDNGTTLNAELFSLIKEGSCLIETALKARGTNSMEPGDDESYRRFVQRVDAKLQIVLAYTMGLELREIDLDKSAPDKASLELVETEGVFQSLEPYMKLSPGSAKANLAARLRTAFDAALAKAQAGDTTWTNEFDAAGLLGEVETAFSIDVKS